MSGEQHAVDIVVNAKDNASKTLGGILGSLGGSAIKFGALAKVGSMATQTLVSGVKNFAKASIQTGMDFSSAMSEVGAISGATGQQLTSLTDFARQMGATTQFSAAEAADGLKYMAMAGWDTQQMISGLPGILDLAAASGEDLGTTSDIVTDALTAFGLQASDSGHFADILAMASNKANTNVSMLGESFKYVAPVAGALGYSAEDTSVALGLMANSGIKASQAGTALRTMLTNMANPTASMATAMDELGLSLTNTDGSMKSLGQVTADIQTAFRGLTEEQKAQYAATIAGKEGMSGFLAIANATEQDTSKLTDAIYDCDGAAKQMAETMNDNLQGDLRKLNSAWEELQLQLFDAVAPAFRTVVQAITENVIPALSDLLSFLTSLDIGGFFEGFDPKPIIGIAAAVGGAILAIKGFGFLKSFNPFAPFAKRGRTTFSQLGAGLGNLVQKSLKGVGDMAKGIEVGFGQMSKNIMTGFATSMKMLSTIPLTGVASALLSIAGVVAIVTAAFLTLAACRDMVLPFLQGLGDILVGVLDGALQAIANALVTLSPVIDVVAQAFARLAPLVEAFGTAIATVVTAIGGAVAEIITAIAPIVQIIGDVFTQCVQIVADAIVQIVEALAPFAPNLDSMAQSVSKAIVAICDSFNNLVNKVEPILQKIKEIIEQFGDSISQVLESAGDVIEDFGNSARNILDGIAGIFDSIGNAALNAGKGFNQLATGIGKLVAMPLADLTGTLMATAGGLTAIAGSVTGLGDSGVQIQALANGLTMIANNVNGIVSASAMMPQVVAQFQSLSNLSGPLQQASASLTSFASSVVSASVSMMTAGVGFTMISAMAMQAVSGLTALGATGAVVASAMSTIMTSTASATSSIQSFASASTSSFSQVGSEASSMASAVNSAMAAMASAFSSGVSKAKSQLQNLMSAMRSSASQAGVIGQQTGRNYSSGLGSGLSSAVGIARSMVSAIMSALSSAASSAYSIGYNIGAGLANGMAASLGRVQSIAAQLASAAAKATAAAAEVKSPSRVFMRIGRYFGEGLGIGIEKMQGYVERASEQLVSIPTLAMADMPNLAYAGTDFSSAYNASFDAPNRDVIVYTSLDINGREFASATYEDRKEVDSMKDKFKKKIKGER